MTERLRCLVPFCRRTWKGDGWATEWICGRHWRETNQKRRRAYCRMKNRFRRWGDRCARARAEVMWEALKGEAIERAAGL